MQEENKKLKIKFRSVIDKMSKSFKKNFLFATLSFLYITIFIQVFGLIFGKQNSIIAIIFTILMGICAGNDVTVAPLKHFVKQTVIFASMAVLACFSVALGTWIAIPINLFATFCILYAFTYEYSHHLYFPYILSYLFMIFISPVQPSRLPFRLLAIVVCSVFMILYSLVLNFRNIKKPARNSLTSLFDEISSCTDLLVCGKPLKDNIMEIRAMLHEISNNVDKRRKSTFELPNEAIAVLDTARGLENLILYLHDPVWQEIGFDANTQIQIDNTLDSFRLFINHKNYFIPEVNLDDYNKNKSTLRIGQLLYFCRSKVLDSGGIKNKHRRKTSQLSLSQKIKYAVNFSPVRFVYAIRVAILLTLFIIPVQYLNLAHGKWLIFTIASVSLPYAEDVGMKGIKRLTATVIGGLIATVYFSLVSNTAARTALMLISGYISFYFSGYVGTYSCATIGALGGAVLANASGWAQVGTMFGTRISYIAAGIILAYIFNVIICPFRRKTASEILYKKYDLTSKMLSSPKQTKIDSQIYYNLVVQNNLLEEKLLSNASIGKQEEKISGIVRHNRENIRKSQNERFKHHDDDG